MPCHARSTCSTHAWNGKRDASRLMHARPRSTFEAEWLVRMPRELHEVGVLQLAVPAEVVDDLHLPHGPRWRRPAPLRVRLLHPAAAHPPPFRLHSPPSTPSSPSTQATPSSQLRSDLVAHAGQVLLYEVGWKALPLVRRRRRNGVGTGRQPSPPLHTYSTFITPWWPATWLRHTVQTHGTWKPRKKKPFARAGASSIEHGGLLPRIHGARSGGAGRPAVDGDFCYSSRVQRRDAKAPRVQAWPSPCFAHKEASNRVL
jgi:hypothetical protein